MWIKKSAWKKTEAKNKMGRWSLQPVFSLTFPEDAVQSRQQAKKQQNHHVWLLRCFKMSTRNQLLILLRFPLRAEGKGGRPQTPAPPLMECLQEVTQRDGAFSDSSATFSQRFGTVGAFIVFPHCGCRISDFRDGDRHTHGGVKAMFQQRTRR